MSTYWGLNRVDVLDATPLDISGANGDAIAFGRPVDVKRIVAVITTAVTTAAAEITVQKIPLPTGTANPEELGTFVIPVGAAIGEVYYWDVSQIPAGVAISGAKGIGGATTYAEGSGLGLLDVGNQLRVLSDGGPDAGAAVFYAEYQEGPNVGDRFDGIEAANA